MSDSSITFLVLGVMVALFIWNRYPTAVVAVAGALALWGAGVLELGQALEGFSSTTVLFVGALFIVSEALDATGVTAWLGQVLIDRVGTGRTRVVTAVMLLAAVVTSFVTANAAVAALVPVVVIIALRVGQFASQMMMPLAFAAHAGSLLTLTGRPANVILSEAAAEAGVGRFGFFEFAIAGVPLLIGTIAIVLVAGPRLLPRRDPTFATPDLSALEETLRRHYRVVDGIDGELFGRKYGAAEFVVTPRSALVGRTLGPSDAVPDTELEVLAIARGSRRFDRSVVLDAGDTLLVRGSWQALSAGSAGGGIRAIDSPDLVRRQAVPLGLGAAETAVILAGLVVVLVFGLMPPAPAAMVAACLIVVLRVLTIDQAFAAVNWSAVVLVAGMLPLSTAMRTSGAADLIAARLVDVVGDAGPGPLLFALFVVTALLGQVMSNTATTLILIPIGLAAAGQLDVAVEPVLMCIGVGSAAALLTPVATPSNMMVMDPGGYRFGDYWKLGSVVLVWYALVAVVFVPFVLGT